MEDEQEEGSEEKIISTDSERESVSEPLASVFQLKDTRRLTPTSSIDFQTAPSEKKSVGYSGGVEEGGERKKTLCSSKRPTPSKASLRQGMITEHKVIVGRRHFTPTREYLDEEGKNLDLDAKITLLNEKKIAADNGVLGLERVRGSVWLNSAISAGGVEFLKAVIVQNFYEKNLIELQKIGQFVLFGSSREEIKCLNVLMLSFVIVWEGEANATSYTTRISSL
ncbi:unnamed protein product [Linum trigynum]|uniref:Uncharacterized protein n=1 Tax=Linum trigynum TaxID=586398 RepID=A0AAV2DLT8_9ROSI